MKEHITNTSIWKTYTTYYIRKNEQQLTYCLGRSEQNDKAHINYITEEILVQALLYKDTMRTV